MMNQEQMEGCHLRVWPNLVPLSLHGPPKNLPALNDASYPTLLRVITLITSITNNDFLGEFRKRPLKVLDIMTGLFSLNLVF